MLISFNSINHKLATLWSIIFLLPFSFAITTAITSFKPFVNLIASGGRATAFGLVIFYIGLIGLPLASLVNLASMLSIRLAFTKWSVEGKIAFAPKAINLIIGTIALLVALIFGGHLMIDAIACLAGNIPACEWNGR